MWKSGRNRHFFTRTSSWHHVKITTRKSFFRQHRTAIYDVCALVANCSFSSFVTCLSVAPSAPSFYHRCRRCRYEINVCAMFWFSRNAQFDYLAFMPKIDDNNRHRDHRLCNRTGNVPPLSLLYAMFRRFGAESAMWLASIQLALIRYIIPDTLAA